MTTKRKDAAFRLGVELGARKLRLEAATDDNEQAFRAAELAILFDDNLPFIIEVLKGRQTGNADIVVRGLTL